MRASTCLDKLRQAWTSNGDAICADCDWFALEPESAWHGACLAFPIRNVRLSGVGKPFSAYERVKSWQSACPGFVDKGRLWRRKPVKMERGSHDMR